MDKQKIFVYDTTNGFSRFLKINFSDQYNFDVCNNPKNFEDCFEGNYKIGFITINKYEDLIYFAFIQSVVKFIFVVSNIAELNILFSKLNKVILINLKELKSETIRLISYNLDTIKLNEMN